MKTTFLAVLTALPALILAKPGVDQAIAQLELSNSKLLQYPTQFTQGIMPRAIHSHNDCELLGDVVYAASNSTELCHAHVTCDRMTTRRLEGRAAADRAELWGRERRGGCIADQRHSVREYCGSRAMVAGAHADHVMAVGRARAWGIDEGPHVRFVVCSTLAANSEQAKPEECVYC